MNKGYAGEGVDVARNQLAPGVIAGGVRSLQRSRVALIATNRNEREPAEESRLYMVPRDSTSEGRASAGGAAERSRKHRTILAAQHTCSNSALAA